MREQRFYIAKFDLTKPDIWFLHAKLTLRDANVPRNRQVSILLQYLPSALKEQLTPYILKENNYDEVCRYIKNKVMNYQCKSQEEKYCGLTEYVPMDKRAPTEQLSFLRRQMGDAKGQTKWLKALFNQSININFIEKGTLQRTSKYSYS